MTAFRAPTMAELVVMIRDEPNEATRARLLDWYWAKAAARDGILLAHWHRREYEWLVDRRRLEAERVDRIRCRRALGSYWRRLRAVA